MKNKYLTKCLCITIISATVVSCPAIAMCAEAETFTSEATFDDEPSEVTPEPAAPAESVAPVPTSETEISSGPEEEPVAPTPDTSEEVTPDITGEEVTPTPEEPTATPTETPGDADFTPPASDSNETPAEPSETPAQPDETPAGSDDTTIPTPTPGDADSTPTPDPGNTPTPDPTATPSPTPEELIPMEVKKLIEQIEELSQKTISLDHKVQIETMRKTYDALSSEDKSLVTNYQKLVDMETEIARLAAVSDPTLGGDTNIGDGTTSAEAVIGTPVYYTSTNMVSNLHAGKDFYLNSLSENYQLSFSDDFASVMDEIEKEYKEKQKLSDASDIRNDGVTTSGDTLLVRNWQDILAVYVYEKSLEGSTSFTLDATCKEELAQIFEEMNPVIRDKTDITKVTYGNRTIDYYIKKNNLQQEDTEILEKYVETDCKLLCAVVTASKGFVRESVGDDVSEERVGVISAAYSLVGKIGYFWGGKSTVIGEDPNWGLVTQVSATGSNSTGTLRAYGLDCSGFVEWSVVNGYKNRSMASVAGDGTSEQWELANLVSESDAQPGDLVFQRGPEAGSDNHVGIICGQTDAGDWIVVHCSASKNGVTVGEAYSAGFRYIRQPSYYPTEAEQEEMESNGFASTASELTDGIFVSDAFQDIINANKDMFSSDEISIVDAALTSETEATEKTTEETTEEAAQITDSSSEEKEAFESTEGTETAETFEDTEDTRTAEAFENAGDTETAEAFENAEDTKTTESFESTETTDTAETTETAESFESTEDTETTESLENTETTDTTEAFEDTQDTETAEAFEMAEVFKNIEAAEVTETPEVSESAELFKFSSGTQQGSVTTEAAGLVLPTSIIAELADSTEKTAAVEVSGPVLPASMIAEINNAEETAAVEAAGPVFSASMIAELTDSTEETTAIEAAGPVLPAFQIAEMADSAEVTDSAEETTAMETTVAAEKTAAVEVAGPVLPISKKAKTSVATQITDGENDIVVFSASSTETAADFTVPQSDISAEPEFSDTEVFGDTYK